MARSHIYNNDGVAYDAIIASISVGNTNNAVTVAVGLDDDDAENDGDNC